MPTRVALSVCAMVALNKSGASPFKRANGLILSTRGPGRGRTTAFAEVGFHPGSSSYLIVSGTGLNGARDICERKKNMKASAISYVGMAGKVSTDRPFGFAHESAAEQRKRCQRAGQRYPQIGYVKSGRNYIRNV